MAPPYYLKIAQDIAFRIAGGELAEGQRIYGRSGIANESKTSTETRRRRGAVVISKDNAARYISNFEDDNSINSLLYQLRELKLQYDELNGKIVDTVEEIIHTRYSFSAANEPLPNYEVSIPEDSWLIGKSIGELKFWQSTGATIIAIRRGQTVILSPGPYAELYNGDAVIIIGTPAAAETAERFIIRKEEMHDTI